MAHDRPDAWKHEKLGEERLPVVGNVHLALQAERFFPKVGIAAAEGMHEKLVDASLQESVQLPVGNAEGIGKVEAEASHVCPEAELLLFVLRVGDAFPAPRVGEGGVVDVCHLASAGQEEGYLDVFAPIGFGVEEPGVLLHCLEHPFVAVECRAEVEHTHVLLNDDVQDLPVLFFLWFHLNE